MALTPSSSSSSAGSGSSISAAALTLPVAPTNGQVAILTDSLTVPTYQWLLQYDASLTGSSKWRFIGGTPAVAIVNTDQATASAVYTDLATVGPAITLPVAGTYQPTFSAETYNSTAGTPDMFVTLKLGAAAASDTNAAGVVVPAANHATEAVRQLGPLAAAAADVWKLMYKTNTPTANFRYRALSVVPVVIG